MTINETVILNLVTPHMTRNVLSRDMFDKLFSILSAAEQDLVADILADHSIGLTDANDTDTLPLYDNSVFGGNDPLAFSGIAKANGGRMNELLAKAAQAGNRDALDQLFRDNERLIWDIVRRFRGTYGKNCLAEEDLFQAGACGMMKAVERFNYDLGYKFTTYASWWIHQAVIREIENNGRTIRVPVHKQEQVRKVMRVYNELYHKGVPARNRIYETAKALTEAGYSMTEEQILECIQIQEFIIKAVSLETPIGEDGDSVLADFIPADREENPEVLLDRICMKADLMEVLRTLQPKEQQIIIERYGLDEQGPRTLDEIGKEFRVTRERIRQIEAKALRKLRQPSRCSRLKDYLDTAA